MLVIREEEAAVPNDDNDPIDPLHPNRMQGAGGYGYPAYDP